MNRPFLIVVAALITLAACSNTGGEPPRTAACSCALLYQLPDSASLAQKVTVADSLLRQAAAHHCQPAQIDSLLLGVHRLFAEGATITLWQNDSTYALYSPETFVYKHALLPAQSLAFAFADLVVYSDLRQQPDSTWVASRQLYRDVVAYDSLGFPQTEKSFAVVFPYTPSEEGGVEPPRIFSLHYHLTPTKP